MLQQHADSDSVSWNLIRPYRILSLIEAGSQIQAGLQYKPGGSQWFVLIEARSPI